jgi:hypothetical protein
MKKLLQAVVVAAMLAAVLAGTVSAATRKPLAYRYGNCGGISQCTYEGTTNPAQSKIAISARKLCTTGAEALVRAGFVTIHNGRFSFSKSLTFANGFGQSVTVAVKFNGTFSRGKSVKGSVKITTTSADCASETGATKSFKLKYKGPSYGG